MKVLRIVANIETSDAQKADAFYRGVLGLDLAMDHGWLRTYTSNARMTAIPASWNFVTVSSSAASRPLLK